MKTTDWLQRLIAGESPPLAAWLAEPVTAQEAGTALRTLGLALRAGELAPDRRFMLRLAEMIARYWKGQDAGMNYQSMVATVSEARHRAQLELCYGQLLMARKSTSAWQHLDAGFAAAAHLLPPEAYFTVLKRHETLRALPLSEETSDAAGLDDLLSEARVIRELNGVLHRGRRTGLKHNDTLD